jgi:enoyl-CoA hydratase
VVTVELVNAKSMNILGGEAADEAVRACPSPVIARLSGWCVGAGLEVAVSCDLRVVGSGATFGMPEVEVGIPSVIHAALIPAMIGTSRAAWLMLTGSTSGPT